jgi:hypothetical protein
MLKQQQHNINPVMRSSNMQSSLAPQLNSINLNPSLPPIPILIPRKQQLNKPPIPTRTSPMQWGPPQFISTILAPNGTLSFQQQPNNLLPPSKSTILISRKIMQSIPPPQIFLINIRPTHNQQLQNIDMILPSSHHKRRATLLVSRIRRSAMIKEQANDGGKVALDGTVEW